MKILRNLFASLFGSTPKKSNNSERVKKLEATMQYIFTEIVAAMEIDPSVGLYPDDELIFRVAQVLGDMRIMKEQQQPKKNPLQKPVTKQTPVVTQKKVRTYH